MDESNLQRLQDERDQLKRSSKEASQVLKLEAAGNRSTASADVVRSSRDPEYGPSLYISGNKASDPIFDPKP